MSNLREAIEQQLEYGITIDHEPGMEDTVDAILDAVIEALPRPLHLNNREFDRGELVMLNKVREFLQSAKSKETK